jgi:hypothetical protein
MPKAAFELEAGATSDSVQQLPQMLSQHLNRRFKSTPVEQTLSIWGVDVELGRRTVTIGVKKSKRSEGLWILMVGPGGARGILALLCGRSAMDMSTDLLPICREIHVFLTSTPTISEVRWYVRGSRTAMHTPEELPWRQA